MPDSERVRLVVELPTSTVSLIWGSVEAAEADLRERTVLSLFAEGKIASGTAAGLLGLSRWDFLDLLVRRGVAWPISPEEAAEDVSTLERVMPPDGGQ
jgi:predicted HTH domain antitoxin